MDACGNGQAASAGCASARLEAIEAIDAACQNLSSDQCKGLRQDLAVMAGSYDELLDGEYIGTMRSVYKDGAKQVDDLMWQYATADAIAQRDASIQLLATTHKISPEAAKVLYYGIAGIHTTAAMVGAVYGMKGPRSSLFLHLKDQISLLMVNSLMLRGYRYPFLPVLGLLAGFLMFFNLVEIHSTRVQLML